jgi:hypothetical protein
LADVLDVVRRAEEAGYRADSFRLDVPAVAELVAAMDQRAGQTLGTRSMRDLVEQGALPQLARVG